MSHLPSVPSSPPTADVILAEPAGRRLDAWVHEYVFGKLVKWVSGHPFTDEVGLLGWDAVPRYTGEAAPAWSVVEAASTRAGIELAEINVRPLAVPSHWYTAMFFREVPGGGKWTPHTRYGAVAATMSEAVCRAALLAAISVLLEETT